MTITTQPNQSGLPDAHSLRLAQPAYGASMHTGSDETGWEWATVHVHADASQQVTCRDHGNVGVSVEVIDPDRGVVTLHLPPAVVTAIENRRDRR